MKWVQKYSSEHVEKLLKYINSAKSLHKIRETAINIGIYSEYKKNYLLTQYELCKCIFFA